jgi:hypothetical protein
MFDQFRAFDARRAEAAWMVVAPVTRSSGHNSVGLTPRRLWDFIQPTG